MRLKIFRAPGTAQAMAQIRQELGPDALILATRRTADGVEVTAALEPNPIEEPPPAPPEPDHHAPLSWHGLPPALIALLGSDMLERSLALHLSFGPLPLAPDDRPIVFAGPPGAGKTLTTARLAARLVMAGQAPMVISTDGRRAGATEQLAAFTRLMRLNLMVANNPVALGRALARRGGAGPVLIDTPGTDPFDATQRDELAALAATANALIAFVLPAGTDVAEAADLALAFADLGATHLIATRLDAMRRLGAIPAAAHAGRLTLAEAGIGPGVADGLVPFTPDLLAEQLRRFQGDHR